MTRTCYVIRNGELVEKHLAGLDDSGESSTGFIPDIQSFVSPIDGTIINSRSQYRDHCKKHDVVPTSELAGLPNQRTPAARTKKDIEHTKRLIADQLYRR